MRFGVHYNPIQIMQHLATRKSDRAKLDQCRIVIRQELEEIEKLIVENQGLKKELQLAHVSQHSLSQTVKQLQGQKQQQQRNNKGQSQQIITENVKLALELTQKNSEISNLQHELSVLREQLNTSKRQHSKCLEQLAASKKEVGLLLQRTKLEEEEKGELARRIEETDKYHQIEVHELKKINSIIRRNFQEMERDYDSLLRLTDQETKEYQPKKPLPQRRSKPAKLSQTAGVKLGQPHNPQMAEQLWQIKKQVSDQMSRISSSREQAVKGRVDRTLATIQSLLIEMSHRADSDSESN